ncbi:MAG TPA: DUF1344 domain-containing protein [Bauldia sp.]|nr:DUF1344 domain-containing protein [Bauldia sp.]
MRIAFPAAALAVALSASVALAATHTETGVIDKIDTKAPTITLKTGKVKVFWLDKAVSVDDFKVGEKVKVTYDIVNKKPVATAIAMVPAN